MKNSETATAGRWLVVEISCFKSVDTTSNISERDAVAPPTSTFPFPIAILRNILALSGVFSPDQRCLLGRSVLN